MILILQGEASRDRLWIFLAYVIGMAIWLRLVVFLNHKSGNIFGLDGVGCGTYLCVVFIAVCWPLPSLVSVQFSYYIGSFGSHGEDPDG